MISLNFVKRINFEEKKHHSNLIGLFYEVAICICLVLNKMNLFNGGFLLVSRLKAERNFVYLFYLNLDQTLLSRR